MLDWLFELVFFLSDGYWFGGILGDFVCWWCWFDGLSVVLWFGLCLVNTIVVIDYVWIIASFRWLEFDWLVVIVVIVWCIVYT